MKFIVTILFTLGPIVHAATCPKFGELTQKKVVKSIGLSFKHPVGFTATGMNMSIAYVGIISRTFYEKGKPSRMAKVEIKVGKRKPYGQESMERILKMREKKDRYKKVGSIAIKGKEFPIHQTKSRRSETKYYRVFYPWKEGEYVGVKTSATHGKFPESCQEKFNQFALDILKTVQYESVPGEKGAASKSSYDIDLKQGSDGKVKVKHQGGSSKYKEILNRIKQRRKNED